MKTKGIVVENKRSKSYYILVLQELANEEPVINTLKTKQCFLERMSSISSDIMEVRDTDWRFIDEPQIKYTKRMVGPNRDSRKCLNCEVMQLGYNSTDSTCGKCPQKVVQRETIEVEIVNPGNPLEVY